MFNSKLYYQKWNTEHREMKRQWQWNKRHSVENIKIKPVKLPIGLPEHSTGSKRKCCWCGNEEEGIFCSKKCQSEYEKLGMPETLG